ncbi:AAA family ATPase [Rhodoferax ferrireducens]|uniref:AAA family ATPase n=1 Tax=Rhodoferax ferrireducens TaxID=192843 RepID=UPI000E0D53BD|nr:AAA family ATPase [Rhodoferax ferrireducens]
MMAITPPSFPRNGRQNSPGTFDVKTHSTNNTNTENVPKMNLDRQNWKSSKLQTQVVSFANGIHLVPAAKIQPLQINWIWKSWIAAGKFHLLAGAPGTGKTTLAMQLVAAISNGGFDRCLWPDNSQTPGGNVIIWSGEDGIEDTIIPRLIAAGANLNNVHIIRGTVEHGRSRGFDFMSDLQKLINKIEEIGGVIMIVIDSIVQIVAGDSNKNSDVRKALAPLIELGEKYRCAILGITHVNKNSSGKAALDRVTGSLAYGAAARIVLFTTKVQSGSEDDAPGRCVLVRAKSNIGPDDGGFEYQIQSASFQSQGQTFHSSKVVWNTTPLQGSAKDIIRWAETGSVPESSSAVELAGRFLLEHLAGGGLSFTAIEQLAQAACVPMSAIKRAKAVLGIRSQKQRDSGQANPPNFWFLPEATNGQISIGNEASPFGVASYAPARMGVPQDSTILPSSIHPFAPTASVATVDPLASVASVAPVNQGTERQLDEALLHFCSQECRKQIYSTTYDSDDDKQDAIFKIIKSVLNDYVDDGSDDNPLIDQYQIELEKIDWNFGNF